MGLSLARIEAVMVTGQDKGRVLTAAGNLGPQANV